MSHPPTAQLVTSSDGTKIYADAAGNPANPSIVFLHGFAVTGFVFDSLFTNDEFLKEFYLVRYDMRGQGRSGKPTEESAHESALYAADYVAVASAFNLVKPIFLGWSLGSAVISDLVAHPPSRPELRPAGFVSLSGLVSLEFFPAIATPALAEALGGFVTPPGPTPAVRDYFVDLCFSPPFAAPAAALRLPSAEAALAAAAGPDAVPLPHALRLAFLGAGALHTPASAALVGTRAPALLAAPSSTPLLILHGTRDKTLDGAALAAAVRASGKFPDLEVQLVEGGHTLWLENEAAWFGALLPFARRVRGKA